MSVITLPTTLAHMAAPREGPLKVALKVRARGVWEYWYPWFFGGATAAAVMYVNLPREWVYDALRGCLSSAVDAAAVLAGFQGTALGLLLTLLNSPAVKKLREMGFFRRLVHFHLHAIVAMLAAVGVSMALLAVQGVTKDFGDWTRAIAGLVAFIAVAASLAALRVTTLMVKILSLDPAKLTG